MANGNCATRCGVTGEVNVRLIARLDIKGANLVKGIQLEGLRVLGDPQQFAESYYASGVDELIYMDIVASLYGRNSLSEFVERTARDIFVPITVGGGIRSVEDARTLLRSGADKVAINSAAIRRPQLLTEISEEFGSQCCVASIEAKRVPGTDDKWEALMEQGRERTQRDVIEWTQEAIERGAGEVLLTSIDQDGTRRGFDIALIRRIASSASVPVIASGGMGTVQHLIQAVTEAGADAVAMASVLHYQKLTLQQVRGQVVGKIKVRPQ